MKTYKLLPEPIQTPVLFAILMLTRDCPFGTDVLPFYTAQFVMLGLMCLLGLLFLVRNREDLGEILRDRRMVLFFLTAVMALLPMLCKRDWQFMYFSCLLAIWFGIFLSFVIPWRTLAKGYVVGLCVLAVYSVFPAYIFRRFADQGMLVPHTYVNTMGNEFYFYGLSVVPVHMMQLRNHSMFREPGVFQFFLILGLYLNHWVIPWGKQYKLWICSAILSVAMVTTFATGGMLELALLFAVLFFEQKWYKRRIAWAALAVLAAAVGCVLAFSGGAIEQELSWMVMKIFNGSLSITDRLGSITGNASFFLHSPLVGAPISKVLTVVENNTSSSTILYAILGVFGGTLNAAAWLAFLWEKKRSIAANLALLLILFMSFNTENLITNPIFWLFPMMAFAESWVHLGERQFARRKGNA